MVREGLLRGKAGSERTSLSGVTIDRYFGEMRALARSLVQPAAHDRVELPIVQFDRPWVAGFLPDDLVFRVLLAHDVPPREAQNVIASIAMDT
jgi:hypothetical protein